MKRTIALSTILVLALVFAQGAQAQDTKAEPKAKIEVKADVKTDPKAAVEPPLTGPNAVPPMPKAEPKAEPKKAPKPPAKDEVDASADSPTDMVTGAINAAQHGQWALLVAFIVMLLTWAVNKLFKEKIPKNVLPWLAMLLGVLGDGALVLAYNGSWAAALVGGISAGMTAAGAYSALGKHMPIIGSGKKEVPTATEKPIIAEDKPKVIAEDKPKDPA